MSASTSENDQLLAGGQSTVGGPGPANDAPFRFANPASKRRMLIIVNPYATTVSDRLRHLVVYALQGRFEVDAVDTEARGHATELCREAAHEGYDVVVAFGGDGTVNEAANGLLGSPTPLCCLPGGSANVFAKMLGIPGDVVDATEHLLAMADDWRPRKVDLGVVNGRCFTFASGLGLDASVVERVDANPRHEGAPGALLLHVDGHQHVPAPLLVSPPRLEVQAGERRDARGRHRDRAERLAVHLLPGPSDRDRRRRGARLGRARRRRAAPRDAAVDAVHRLARALGRARVAGNRQVTGLRDLNELVVRSVDGRPLPLQVDGDYLGEVTEARYSVMPGALNVVA